MLIGDVGVIDYPKRTPIYRTANEFNSSGYNATRNRLYGKGFIYGLFLSETADLQNERNPTVVEVPYTYIHTYIHTCKLSY